MANLSSELRPYYQDDLVTLYHADCLDVLPALAPSSVNHCVTDPPYILQAGSSATRGSKTGGWADMMNSSLWYSQWLSMVSRAVRDDGSIWSFLNWRSLPVYMRAAIDAGLPTSSLMVWDKKWIGPAGPQSLRSTHEFCLLMPHPGFKIVDRSASDVFHFQASSSKPTGHPAEKPVGLLERVVDLTGCGIGECILDPFAGSGTTLVAAKQNGIRAIGIEAEERWCEVAAARLCQNAFDLGEVAS